MKKKRKTFLDKLVNSNPDVNIKALWSEVARLGGLSRSKKKKAASRENGKKGGRPRGKSKGRK